MGRPWPQAGEPLFTDQDTEEILEYFREKALECPGCGHPRDESMAKENQFAYAAEPIRCHACKARDEAAQEWVRKRGDSAGINFSVFRPND